MRSVSSFVSIMMAVCFLVVPYACLRFGMEHPSWRRPAALVIVAAVLTPLVGLAWSYSQWRAHCRQFLSRPKPIEVVSGERLDHTLFVEGTPKDGRVEYTMPDGEVLRLSPPDWRPWGIAEPRMDQSVVLAGSSLSLGGLGFASGRVVARRRSRGAAGAGAPSADDGARTLQ
jgi:hypothetical protein